VANHRVPRPRKKGKSDNTIEEEAKGCKNVVLPWVKDLKTLQELGSDENGIFIDNNEDGDLTAWFRLGRDYDHPFVVDVNFDNPNVKPSWYGKQMSIDSWTMFPSLHMPEVFHCFATITEVPSPAPWLKLGDGWRTHINEKDGSVFIFRQIGSIKGPNIKSWC